MNLSLHAMNRLKPPPLDSPETLETKKIVTEILEETMANALYMNDFIQKTIDENEEVIKTLLPKIQITPHIANTMAGLAIRINSPKMLALYVTTKKVCFDQVLKHLDIIIDHAIQMRHYDVFAWLVAKNYVSIERIEKAAHNVWGYRCVNSKNIKPLTPTEFISRVRIYVD